MEQTNDWSARLREAQDKAKREHGVTLDQIAEACETTRPTVIDWMRGDGPGPRLSQIPALCRTLRVSPRWLVFGAEKAA